jgi:hypothetical protein
MKKNAVFLALVAFTTMWCDCWMPISINDSGPHCVIIYPYDSTTISDTITICAAGEKNVTIDKITFYLNGAVLGESRTKPYSLYFDPYFYLSTAPMGLSGFGSWTRLSARAFSSGGQGGPEDFIAVNILDDGNRRVIISPHWRDTITESNRVPFNWNLIKGASGYIIAISKNAQFQNSIILDTIADTTDTVKLDTGYYYWRIRGLNANKIAGYWSLYSPGFTVSGPLPPAFSGQTYYNAGQSINVSFSESKYADVYECQIATDTLFADSLRDQKQQTPLFSFGVLPEGPYYMRVRAINGSGMCGPWSACYGIGVNVFSKIIPSTMSLSPLKAGLLTGGGLAILASTQSMSSNASYIIVLDSLGNVQHIDNLQANGIYSSDAQSFSNTEDSGFVCSITAREIDSSFHLIHSTHVYRYDAHGTRSKEIQINETWSYLIQLNSTDFIAALWEPSYSDIALYAYGNDFSVKWNKTYGYDIFASTNHGTVQKLWQSETGAISIITEDLNQHDKYYLEIDTTGLAGKSYMFDDRSMVISSIIMEIGGKISCIGMKPPHRSLMQFDENGHCISNIALVDSLVDGTCMFELTDGNLLCVNQWSGGCIRTSIISKSGLVLQRASVAINGMFQLMQALLLPAGNVLFVGVLYQYNGLPSQLVICKTDKLGRGLRLHGT